MENSILLKEDIRIPKGNFSFLLEATQNETLFLAFADAEKKVFTESTECLRSMRTALEEMAWDLESRKRLPTADPQARAAQIGEIKREKMEDSRQHAAGALTAKSCINEKIHTLTYIPDQMLKRYLEFRPVIFEKKDLDGNISISRRRMLLCKTVSDFYGYCSNFVHNAVRDPKDLVFLMEHLFSLTCLFYGKKGVFDERLCPYGDYYPVPLKYYDALSLNPDPGLPIYVNNADGRLRYALLKPLGLVKRKELAVLDLLWNKTVETPSNILPIGEMIGEGDYRRQVYVFPQPPKRITDSFIADWTSDQCAEVVNGILCAIRSAHNTEPRIALRGLTPASIYICDINGAYKPYIVDFSTAKNWDGSATVRGDLKRITEENAFRMSFIAPEVFSAAEAEADTQYKADIYSVGKLIEYIYCRANAAQILRDPVFLTKLKQLLLSFTAEDCAARPDICRAIEVFRECFIKRIAAVCSLIGPRTEQQDAFYCSFTKKKQANCFTKSTEMILPAVAAVFDGIGGGLYGREIALFAAELTEEYFYNTPYSSPDDLPALTRFLCEKCEAFCIEKGIKNSGTTFAAAVITENHVYTANMGDCRILLCHGEEIRMLAKDHRLPFKGGAVYQYLGMRLDEYEPEPYYADLYLEKNDVIIAATDGLTDYVTDAQILQIIRQYESSEEILTALCRAAQTNNSTDNITVFVYRNT